ncbi:hypothetical protein [Methylobacterium haplocladii]|uniref:Uncharacterized protein n=1 Tax=Methylobacterium haplocladii TaxID=1176176 RepID=A0A512IJ66_9HYPH|nr:hypothetical protein [Methylobacterium haplocladii]GEO97749.1 hypothetical protein MHA02_01370 [Methylobacterium haplocladii]GJD84065.1 hypothetical protein HPGCJGGD_1940 [Methylobacterium haplocladii]GLS61400.1 hypothetical protein GCM10007887_41080 [Methylobacterium haplocladii]
MRFAQTLAAGLMLGGLALGANSASAAPAMPQPGVLAGDPVEQVMHRHRHHHGHHHYGHGRTTKAERMHRRANTMRHGNPNSRNPERPGYQQQLGNTTNGPRY